MSISVKIVYSLKDYRQKMSNALRFRYNLPLNESVEMLQVEKELVTDYTNCVYKLYQ